MPSIHLNSHIYKNIKIKNPPPGTIQGLRLLGFMIKRDLNLRLLPSGYPGTPYAFDRFGN
jgi:hypothetical protein